MGSKQNAERVLLCIAIGLAAVTSIALFRGGALWWDETVYLGISDNLYSSHEFKFNMNNEEEFRAPTLPAAIAASYFILGQSETSAKIVIFAFSIMAVLAVYFLGRRLYNGNAGALGAIVAASAPQFVFWSSKVLSEVPAVLFTAMTLYVIYNIIEEKKTGLYPILGALFAVSFLTRYPLLLLPAFFIIWGVARKRTSLLFCRQALYAAIVFFLILFPWMYNSYAAYGDVLGSAKYNTYIVNDLHSGSWYAYAREFLPNYGVFGAIFLIGIAYSFRKKDNAGMFLASWFLLVFLALSFGIAEKQIRYLIIALPAVALVSANTLFIACKRFRNQALVAGIITLSIALSFFVPEFYRAYTNKQIGLIIPDAGIYLRENVPSGTRIMSQDITPLHYYSKREVIWFPKDIWAVMDFVHRYNVSYVEIDNYVWYPDYALNYFDGKNEFVLEYNRTEGDKFIRIYRYLNA